MSNTIEPTGLYCDERYPFFGISDRANPEVQVDIDAETLARWQSVMDAFEEVQNEMDALFDVAQQEKRRAAAVVKAEKELAEAQARLDAARSSA